MVTQVKNEWPWGDKWPPPKGAGNYRDESWLAKMQSADTRHVKDYNDGHPTTAPVMSFKPNKLGLYDMGGNVAEWSEDWFNEAKQKRLLRGASWDSQYDYDLFSSGRTLEDPSARQKSYGFRIVLETTE